MKLDIKKGLSMGLAATLIMGASLPGVAGAAVTKNPSSVKKQIEEQLGLNKEKVSISSVSKEKSQKFSENQLIVRYKKPLTTLQHKHAGGNLEKRISSLSYDVISVKNASNLAKVASNYAKLPGVVSVTRSALVQQMSQPDMKAPSMYHLETLAIEKAQKMAGKNKVRVGVIDTGIEVNHPELKNKVVVNENAMNPLKKGQPDVHATHVAGIIAAEKGNGIGGYGVAPNSDIVSIDVFNRSPFVTDYTIAEGILEAINQKVKVINMSLGSYYPSPIIKDAVKKATDAGIIIVASAGNDGADMINYPAAFEDVISVGATNDKNELAEFSSYGKNVDVVAPGEAIYGPVFDVDKRSSFAKLSGTSMSAPMVTGLVSLLLSKHPNLTPYQVQYILTKTAKDLGDKGYDTSFGYGMIDPVKVLSFNPASIPANPELPLKEAKKKASLLKVEKKETAKNEFKKLNESHYYQVNMSEGEYLQLSLEGLDLYDFQMELTYFTGEKSEETLDVNASTKKNKEGTLYQAPADGTLLIEVKDSFGHYDEKGNFGYILQAERFNELPEDTNTMESPVSLGQIPANTDLVNYFTDELSLNSDMPEDMPDEMMEEDKSDESDEDSEENEFKGIPGDSDFYKFSVPADDSAMTKAINVKVSGVSGIDSTLSLYMVEKQEGEEFLGQMDSFGLNGTSEGEEITFEVMPGQEYVLEVTNKPFFDEFFFLMGGEFDIDYNRSYSSYEPYKVSIETKDLPADEDQFPRMDMMEEDMEGEMSEKFSEFAQDARQKMISPEEMMMMDQESYYDMVKEIAMPYEEGVSQEGYSQYFGDEDWFSFTPEKDGIYNLTMNDGKGYDVPALEMFVYNEQIKDLDVVFSNGAFSFFSMEPSVKADSYVGLKKDTTYYFRVTDSMYRPSLKPYEFSLNMFKENTNDVYELNDDFKTALKISGKPLTANFASSGDVDTYYFKPEKDGVFGVTAAPTALNKKYNQLPEELKKPIDPVLVILEDKNGNGKLEKEEEANLTFVDYGFNNDAERGAFRGKKGSGYFIVLQNYFRFDSSLVPYILSVKEASKKDEDAGSVVKNNIPTKPIAMNKAYGVSYATGYMNMTSSKGDTDYYQFKQTKDGKRTFRLTLPSDLDGILSVYNSKGKLVAKADNYGKGDIEYLQLTLKKGNYYIKVQDVNGDASVSPYKLYVK
ncbi:S8 family serine peptidase [Rossellomorea aquimaris]|uniref:S8 family serine peptidase n=1 Tax=Rossellomorea aquimaris TaxID=189382 RepID=UPI001CFD6007|nr:S8 family peptidase [Rossellomorea aquimaris]